MERLIHTIYSKSLNREMDIAVYGHFGLALLLFPTFTDDFLENEKHGLVQSIDQYIKSGKIKVFTISGVNSESWLNDELPVEQKSEMHFKYNNFITEEMVPFIIKECGGVVPIITCGASMGAYHAANKYFRRPDMFLGTIALSGNYNLEAFSGGIHDENCYFNSPIHYLPNLTDNYWLSFLMSRHHVYIITGEREGENPDATRHLQHILDSKNIPNNTEYWGTEFGHNWDTWKEMLKNIVAHWL